MKQRTLRERFGYWFDRMMSKGTAAMSVLLFAITAVAVSVIGIAAYFVAGEGSVVGQIWNSLMYTLDSGNLSGVSADNIPYLILMSLATLCGLFLTSVLIGIIATGVEGKLGNLRKGLSVVQEDNHTIIIGFDNNVFEILRELIEANANQKNACVVLLGEQPKEEMEDAVAAYITDTKTTKIICRSGNLHEAYALERCSLETCKSVILNLHDDAETVKVLLALAAYVKGKTLKNKNLRFVASVQNGDVVEAANIAGEGRALIIYAKDAIARIISNTCRQHGLAQVFTELFNFGGDELYYEKVPQLTGKTFKEAVLSFSNAVVLGVYTEGEARLNPPMETVIGPDDLVILLEEDDGAFNYQPAQKADEAAICGGQRAAAQASNNLIILGSNDKLPIILGEYAQYVEAGTRVIIVDDDLDERKLGSYSNLCITVCTEAVTRDLLCGFLDENINNILLLNDDSCDCETADSQTLLRLILLRDIADKKNLKLSITTEMRNVDNQRLASQARVDDFVIGLNFASLMMAQISENPELISLIEDLLDESGSELYMKPVANYVALGVPVDAYTLTESAARKGEIYLGYRRVGEAVVVNPAKSEKVVFSAEDQIVVVAEN